MCWYDLKVAFVRNNRVEFYVVLNKKRKRDGPKSNSVV